MAKPEYDFLLNYTFFNPFDPEGLVNIYVNQPEQYWDLWLTRDAEIQRLSGLGCHLVLIGLGLLMYIIGDQVFTRRDLPARIDSTMSLQVYGKAVDYAKMLFVGNSLRLIP